MPLLGLSRPHPRQAQEAVPRSANTAHCGLSSSAGLTSEGEKNRKKQPAPRCNRLPHCCAHYLTYMHSITAAPQIENLHTRAHFTLQRQ